MKKLIYVRVSKEDENEQNPEDQIPVILNTFKLDKNDCDVVIERGSAYDEKTQHRRQEFIKIKEDIENGTYKEVYVYSLERFERNIKRMLSFYFFCEEHDCKIYSALQPYLNNMLPKSASKESENNPIYTYSTYNAVLIYAFMGQNESYFIGERTKKAFKKIKNSSYSKKGNKVGKKFTNSSGNKINLSARREDEMFEFIVSKMLVFEKRNINGYYPIIINCVKEKYDIILSPAYLSNIKKRLGDADGNE